MHAYAWDGNIWVMGHRHVVRRCILQLHMQIWYNAHRMTTVIARGDMQAIFMIWGEDKWYSAEYANVVIQL